MVIYNFKINTKKIAKFFLIIFIILAIILLIFSAFSIYKSSKNNLNNSNNAANTLEITGSNFTNFLKDCHENIDDYVDMNVKMSGYVYRMTDFNETQFVLSRTMVLNSNNSGVVVGILSESEKANEFSDGEWVTVEGTIARGNYKGEMPILKVTNITLTKAPEDEYVYPPTQSQNS